MIFNLPNGRFFSFYNNKMDSVLVTKEGLEKLVEELNERKTTIAHEIADKIEESRKLGDLSENAGYKAALDDKNYNDNRIYELEEMIKNAKVFKGKKGNSKVDIGDKVTMRNNGNKVVYKIVGRTEANPVEGLISNESPLGAAIIGKKLGDSVDIDTPSGKIKYIIDSVE